MDFLILYKDPEQKEVGAIIDISDKPKKSKSSDEKGLLQGRDVKKVDADLSIAKNILKVSFST